MSLLEKMKKTGYKKVTERTKMVVDAVNDIFGDLVPTDVPAFNIAISGKYNGGVGGGLVSIAGPSKHFKTLFCLLAASAYMNHHEDAIMLYYDSEGGASLEYLKMMNIPVDRVVHIPIENVEELSFDMMQKLDSLTEKEKVFIMIDSVGNLASKKELTDALNEKSVADMTRAKALKGFFRMVTPIIKRLNIPFYVINHTYKSLDHFSVDVVSGGCVVAGTQVRMADGNTKAIEDIRVDEIVATAAGTFKVTHTWDPETLEEGHPECYEITFEDGTVETISYNDHLMIDGKMVQIQDIKAGDLIDIYK